MIHEGYSAIIGAFTTGKLGLLATRRGRRLCGVCGMNHAPKTAEVCKPWNLLPLTPEYVESEHGGYVKAIDAALKDSNIRNIALSGNYGVGKSSILREVAREHSKRVVELSLSTLAPIEEKWLDESIPKQATTPTNRIQQEIVKQLLYREDPNRTPGSRFRKIERFLWRRELAVASLAGFGAMVLFLLTGWSEQITTALKPLFNLGLWVNPVLLASATAVMLALRGLFHGRIHIKQLSAGSAAVTLDDHSVSYFDQYLDEIVYFFEMSKRDIVIFEDIDRFNDSHIFETLRSLNTLLNTSRKHKKPIRFIYAIKDSIFDRIGLAQEGRKPEWDLPEIDDPAQAEAVRANRTKFFDLVIPVVPFITHRSARNLAVQLLQEIDNDVSADLIDLAARYVPDMRLLKNVRNEFVVFRDRVFSGEGKKLDLSETDLFAIMLYKSTHLTDFEAIRIGKSKLDQIYDAGRKLIATNIQEIERQVRMARQRLARLDSVTTRSSYLGDNLIAYVDRVLRQAGIPSGYRTFSFAGAQQTEQDLRSATFWRSLVKSSDEPALTVLTRYSSLPRITISRTDLGAILGDPLKLEEWDESERARLKSALEEYAQHLKFLRSADMGDLVKRPEFGVEHDGGEKSLDAIARDLLTPGLAYQLIRSGHINRNFTLYTSTFHGDRVSPAATNFMIHHVERDVMDEHFELNDSDVDAVIRERGKTSLDEPALYNIAILDHLLHGDVETADIMVSSLLLFGADQMRFLQAYLDAGRERTRLIERLTAVSPRVLMYLISEAELDDATRADLVSVALAALANDIDYRVNASVTEYLEAHYADLPALTSKPLEAPAAERIATIFSKAGIRVPALAPLTESERRVFVAHDLYEISRENLSIALGDTPSLALDVVRQTNEGIYRHTLRNLPAYLLAIDGTSATVDSSARFVSTIKDVLEADGDRLSDVIELASAGCAVTDLTEVPKDAWPALAKNLRFPPTYANVSEYVTSVGSLDAHVALVLASAGTLSGVEGTTDDDKARLAKTILSAVEALPAAALRAALAASLQLTIPLDVSEIAPEEGELFALLVQQGIIPDAEVTYVHLSEMSWPTRERLIQESANFAGYMTPTLLRDDLGRLLASTNVDEAIKLTIIEQAGQYITGASQQALAELARVAVQRGRQLQIDVIETLAGNAVPPGDIVELMKPHIAELATDRLFGILQSLGGEYAKLTFVGRDTPRIPNTAADRILLERLQEHGIVSTLDIAPDLIRVNKKRK